MKLVTSASPSSLTLVLPVVVCVLLCSCVQAWRLDCTKFVFAPRCRGVAAKRSSSSGITSIINANRLGSNALYNHPMAAYQWRPSHIFPFNSFPVLSSIMKAKRTGSTHKSAMEALYNHPDLQKGQRENSFLDAWKSDFKEKPASDFRQKEEETELMKAYMDALWNTMEDTIHDDDDVDSSYEDMSKRRRR